MAIDRDETLRKAEKLLRQGKLEAAIVEYQRVVEDQPRDWATANLLGDLFVRSGQVDRAVAQYARIADHLARDGFVSKATALYKKIVKIRPDDDTALLRVAELAAQQGLIADARGFLQPLYQQRLHRGDRAGAGKIAVRLAELDPANAVARLEAARMLAESGDPTGAADQLRAAGQALCEAGNTAEAIRAWRDALRFNAGDALTRSLIVQALLDVGDPDGARDVARQAGDLRAVADAFVRAGRDADALFTLEQALAADPGNEILCVAAAQAALRRGDVERAQAIIRPLEGDPSPGVQLVRAEIDLRTGRLAQAGRTLDALLASAPDLTAALEDLSSSMAAQAPDAALTVIGALLRRADASGQIEPAIAALEHLVAAAPTHVEALECLVQACSDSFHVDQQYRARVRLADAYLARQRWDDARALSAFLIAQRPEHEPHRARLARALENLGPAAPASSPATGALPGLASEEMLEFLAGLPADPPQEALSFGTVLERPAGDQDVRGNFDVPLPELRDMNHEPSLGESSAAAPAPEAYEIDLSVELEDLLLEADAPGLPGTPAPPAGAADGRDLDEVFQAMRTESGREADAAAAARAYDRASEHYNQGNHEAAVACLREAVRDVSYRFRAASMLARLARERGDVPQAIDWLERAAESPAPAVQASHALLYDLADTLQACGEPDRALAVFLELRASAPSYRDVAARVAGLSGGQKRPATSGRESV